MNRLSLALSALAAASLQLACATPATPPAASPVYGDALNPQVAPISVESTSLNDPESKTMGSTSPSAEPALTEASPAEAEATKETSAPETRAASAANPAGAHPEAAPAEKAPAEKAPAEKAPAANVPAAKKPAPH